MTPEERVVIEAARHHCAALEKGSGRSYQSELRDAMKALIEAERAAPDMERLYGLMAARSYRAANVFRREWEVSFGNWRITVTEFAHLNADTIFWVPNAGPFAWQVWAEALRTLGIEPEWAGAGGLVV